MNLKKALYESPEVEEIVFASVDAIALSKGDDSEDGGNEDDIFGGANSIGY